MSASYVTKRLLELQEEVANMSEEEAKQFLKNYTSKEKSEEGELDISSPAFLRQT